LLATLFVKPQARADAVCTRQKRRVVLDEPSMQEALINDSTFL
jgi:hypothetical protein